MSCRISPRASSRVSTEAEVRQPSGKPNSVGPRPLAGVRAGDHSSGTGITDGLEQPTRRLRTGRPRAPPYLVLLRAGFCLPRPSPAARCALTAPFHPYSPSPSPLRARATASGIFSVPLSVGLPRPGVTRRTALRSSDFPPVADSRPSTSDRLDDCRASILHAGGRRTFTAPIASPWFP